MNKKILWWLIPGSILVIFAVPIVANALLAHEGPSFLAISWEVSDALSYFGPVLGGIGTIFLGAVAYYSNSLL